MKLFKGILIGALMTWFGVSAQAENILTNPGFDDSTGSVVLGEGEAAQFDNGSTITDWQVYAIGNTPGNATFSAQADAEAVSAPNILNYIENDPADSAIRRDSTPTTVVGDRVYLDSYYFRDIDGVLNDINHFTYIFTSAAAVADINFTPTAQWQRGEKSWLCPAGDTQASFQLRINGTSGQVQFDSCAMEDITMGNRMTNGSFENSDSQVISWGIQNWQGREFNATVVTTDAYEGKNCVREYQTAAQAAGSDGYICKDLGNHYLPWTGDDILYVSAYVKDDPTLDTGETVNIAVVQFADDKSFIGAPNQTFDVTSGWTRCEFSVRDMPANTAYVSINIRIGNGTGTNLDADDILVDNVVVVDHSLNPDFVPVEMSSFMVD